MKLGLKDLCWVNVPPRLSFLRIINPNLIYSSTFAASSWVKDPPSSRGRRLPCTIHFSTRKETQQVDGWVHSVSPSLSVFKGQGLYNTLCPHALHPSCLHLPLNCWLPPVCHSEFSRNSAANSGNTLFLSIVWFSRSQHAIYGLLLNQAQRLCMKARGCTVIVIVNTMPLKDAGFTSRTPWQHKCFFFLILSLNHHKLFVNVGSCYHCCTLRFWLLLAECK